MPFEIVQGDITAQTTDAIVNAANERLQAGGGVCGAIFAAAGADRLQAACDRQGYCQTGCSVITPGFDLPAKHVIHAVGPVWRGGGNGEEGLLRACYRSALELARLNGLTSIAFPLISAGIYGYPRDQALSVAVAAIGDFLRSNEMTVRLVIYDRADYRLSDRLRLPLESVLLRSAPPPMAAARARPKPSLLAGLRSLLPDREEDWDASQAVLASERSMDAPKAEVDLSSLKRKLNHVGDGFSQMLFRLIDQRGEPDPEVYKRANLDRKLFSKIRSNPAYRPSKNTALALCVALELNLDQTADLLRRAGYALSPASRADLIVEYFIRKENYDIYEINQALFFFDESLLGA